MKNRTPQDKVQENTLILYQDENGITKVNVRFSQDDLWLTQKQIAEIYDTTQENISMHISSIYTDGELDKNRTYKDFLLVRQEGSRQVHRNIAHYKAEEEFNLYKKREMEQLTSDFDLFMKGVKKIEN